MRVRVEPLLRKQRELYDLGVPEPRFSAYLRLMTGGTDEAVLPLQALNPMGKPHVPERLDALLDLGAESIAESAAERSGRCLHNIDDELRVALVLVDDVAGGWTHRYTTEASLYFEGKYEKVRDWAVVFLWTSERPTGDHIERDVAAAIYRTLHVQRYGLPTDLGAMMRQEGRAAAFAGAGQPALSPDALDALECARKTLARHVDATHFPVTFACMYGDEAARTMGLPPLGLPFRAGFAVGRVDAERAARPETFLIHHERRAI